MSAVAFSRRIAARHRPLAAQSPAGPRVHRLPGGRWQLAWTLSSHLGLSVRLQRLTQSLGVRIDRKATVRREIEPAGPPAATVLRHTHVERVAGRGTDRLRDIRDIREVWHVRRDRDLRSIRSRQLELLDRRTTDVRQLAALARTVAQRTMAERSRERLTSASSSSSSASFFASSSSRFDLRRREIREVVWVERLQSTSLVGDIRRPFEICPTVPLLLSGAAGRNGEGKAGEAGRDGTAGTAVNHASAVWKPLPAPVAVPTPPRPPAAAEAPRGVASLQERRLVEVVQREVKGALASAPPLSRLTREDYGRIADRVYADLARRLAVERERKGL